MTRGDKIKLLYQIASGKATIADFEPLPCEVWLSTDNGATYLKDGLTLTNAMLDKRKAAVFKIEIVYPSDDDL